MWNEFTPWCILCQLLWRMDTSASDLTNTQEWHTTTVLECHHTVMLHQGMKGKERVTFPSFPRIKSPHAHIANIIQYIQQACNEWLKVTINMVYVGEGAWYFTILCVILSPVFYIVPSKGALPKMCFLHHKFKYGFPFHDFNIMKNIFMVEWNSF